MKKTILSHLPSSKKRKGPSAAAIDTVFGKLNLPAPRFDACSGCGERRSISPVSDLLPERVCPELRDLQVKLAADLPYRRASAILRELLPDTAGFNHATTRNRTLALGKRIEQEICDEIDHPQPIAEPAPQMVVGIDGAFVKAVTTEAGQRHQFEILTGRIETTPHSVGEAFAVVRDLDRAKQKVQDVRRRSGRDAKSTELTILSDGEDGLRGVVGWFGKKCKHRLDWFHVARRIERIQKDFLYLPSSTLDDFGDRLAGHYADLSSMKWMLWNDGIETAEFGMTRVRIGLFQHALSLPAVVSRKPFEAIEAKLDELRSYLYANHESTAGYAESYRKGERVSTSHVESTVNQLSASRKPHWLRGGKREHSRSMSGRPGERREQWRQMIAEQEKSGQSIRVYCQGRGVSEYSFYSWRQRLRKEIPVSFALVETKPALQAAEIELVLTTGDRLRIPGDAATLRMVVSVLRERT